MEQTVTPAAPPKKGPGLETIAVGVFFGLMALVGGVFVAVANADDSGKDTRKCEELRQDNLAMTSDMTKPYDLEQVRKNNERIDYLGCVWATDGEAGPVEGHPDSQWSHNE